MRRKQYNCSIRGAYWRIDAPELEAELPELLQEAGTITSTWPSPLGTYVNLALRLHKPAKVVCIERQTLATSPDELIVDGLSLRCSGYNVYLIKKPRNNRTIITLSIACLLRFSEDPEGLSDTELLDRIRNEIRAFAHNATGTWVIMGKEMK